MLYSFPGIIAWKVVIKMNTRIFKTLPTAALIVFLLSGCGIMVPNPASSPTPSPPVSAQAQTLSGREFTDPSVQIEVAAGETFSIVLDSNATTGYQWQVAQPLNENVVKFYTSIYQAPENPIPGAGGRERLTFTATGRGQAAIVLNYLRAWETGASPARTVTFNVTVK
jgi:predicted secreted protein